MTEDNTTKVYLQLIDALVAMRAAKPNDRSEDARRWAVSITEMEKAIAYFAIYVVQGVAWNKPE